MNHFRDNEGRYTKPPYFTIRLRKFYWTFLIATIIISYSYLTIWAYIGIVRAESYNSPQIAVTALKSPNLASERLSTGTIREVTMYNAGDPRQTDDSPCISANGENICNAIALGYKRCAANFVPLGTDLIIENYGECKVTDRMNRRYQNRVDIAVGADEYQRAVNFGLQKLLVTIK